MYYSLTSDRVMQLWQDLREVAAEHVGELDRSAGADLGDRDALESISQAELRSRIRAGDVSPSAEYAAGRIGVARSLPLSDLTRMVRDLPKASDVVAYCRGPHGVVYAADSVSRIRTPAPRPRPPSTRSAIRALGR